MRFDWKEQRLKDFVEINPYSRLPKGAVAKKVSMDKLQPNCRDIPSFELAAYMGGAKFQNGDTLMARITPCLENGKIAQVNILDGNEVGFGSTEYIVFRAKDGISDKDFVYSLVCSSLVREPAIKSMVGSSNRQRVQTDVVENLLISLPPLVEQKKIGELLRSFDDKIRINNAINHNLQQQVFALYRQMFVDKTNDNRQTCRAEQYFDISIGKTPPRKEPEWFSESHDSHVIWVSISDMGGCGMYISDSSEYLTRDAVSRFNIVTIPDNTVILSFKLTVGRVAISDGEMTTNEAIAHFKTDKKEINDYLYCYLKSYNYQTLGSTSSIATAVNSKIIKGMPFIVPSEDELTQFHSFAAPCFEKIRLNQIENARLAVLRDTLLPKLMSGEIDVSDVEI